ncbi:hypothetical protein SPHINGOT1_70085 [Sphingomonas sp. T1]|uniref:glycoside hydrolase family 97 N-terminal domain-containing protein n=2 Tax=unclassified Sphingomonas TaxID=196159 RepID=UPI0004DB5F56|nr:glycoside hydrolase family 97 N-terminal domain-containing protein [Sphingomonas sp. T1]VXD06617.1 hypothetical protein SPHINGOT1_70085 [Sphingomonas sp. T1]
MMIAMSSPPRMSACGQRAMYGPMIIEGSEAVVSSSNGNARHGELLVRARELNGGKRALLLRLRAYDQGAAFRLEIPAEPRQGEIRLSSETTALRFPRDTHAEGETYR